MQLWVLHKFKGIKPFFLSFKLNLEAELSYFY